MKKLSKTLVTLALLAAGSSFAIAQGRGGYNQNYYDYEDEYDDDCEECRAARGQNSSNQRNSSGRAAARDANHPSNWQEKPYSKSKKGNLFGRLGSASEMAGTTVVVTIFADDTNGSWSTAPEKKNDCWNSLKIATEWLSASTKKFGVNSKFIFDWKANNDLVYQVKFKKSLISSDDNDTDDFDMPAWTFIENKIDSAAIIKKYNAQNIIYIVELNTPVSNTVTSCTTKMYEGMYYPYEICYMYQGCDGEAKETPAAYAHEMLHTFGAPDLYSADTDGSNIGMPQAYVDQLENIKSNDIMFTTYEAKSGSPLYNKVSNAFTPVDAYYTGVSKTIPAEVNKWNLDHSEHFGIK